MEDNEDSENPTNAVTFDWSAYYDDEGRIYYYNSVTEESSWEPPEEGFNPPPEPEEAAKPDGKSESADSDQHLEGGDEQVHEGEADASATTTSNWVEYTDDEGRIYYFNTETNETQWEKPEGFSSSAAAEVYEGEDMDVSEQQATYPDDSEMQENPLHEENDRESEDSIPQIDPALRRVHDAEQALARTDSILEPDCMRNVAELVTSENGNPEKAINALIESFYGQTAVCGLLARWLADMQPSNSSELGVPSEQAADKIREVAQDVISKIVRERFSKEAGDSVLNLSKSEAAFLEEMMDSPRWRKLLIDLSAAHKDSALLIYCLRAISKRGHHREIAKRVNQSEHFPVFNAMLLSELTVIGSLAVSAGSDAASAVNLDELISDLRRACSSTSYTYLYSVELLRRLGEKVRRDINPSLDDRFARVQRKWEALAQDLESEMMDPCAPSSASVSSPLFRRRRLEVALTISDLHQRQRKRRRYDDHIEVVNGDCDLETALLDFLRRHASGIQLDNAVLDRLLPQGLDLSTSAATGKLLIEHPLAIRALLGHLYKSGSSRVTAPSIRSKCARLIAFGVIAAETVALEQLQNDESENIPSESDEVAVTRMILEGSQLCEQLEIMVSFLVASGSKSTSVNASPGQKLCSLALKCAAVAQGVLMWAKEFTRGSEFAASASFPTLSVSILSLVRLVCIEQPFTRSMGLEIALAFLGHSNPDISYQKLSAIKEQSLRLLIVLITKGEVVPVLTAFAKRLQGQGSSELDASLIRYFVAGLLEVVQAPVSLVFVWSLASVLETPRCLDAVRSSYFGEPHKSRLSALLQSFKDIKANAEGKDLGVADATLIQSLIELF